MIAIVVVLGSSYDLWRGYHEEGSIGVGIIFAVLGWAIFFAVFAFIRYVFTCRAGKPDSGTH